EPRDHPFAGLNLDGVQKLELVAVRVEQSARGCKRRLYLVRLDDAALDGIEPDRPILPDILLGRLGGYKKPAAILAVPLVTRVVHGKDLCREGDRAKLDLPVADGN